MISSTEFAGRTAFVTGAGTGIGAATSIALAAHGAQVALFGRRSPALETTAAAIAQAGGNALVIAGDVSDPSDVEQAVQQTVRTYGNLHMAVNNAGVDGGTQRLVDVSVESWNETIGINLSGVFFGLKYEIPAMIAAGGGAIVNVSSVFSDRGLVQHAPYTASKHGVHGLTRAAAQDYAAENIRINELLPGVIDTPMLDTNRAMVNQMTAFIPLRRLGLPAEVARTICFMLSDAASYMTGARVAVDGGFLI
ncbi:MAG TPA: SDR family NAD(P)-dependent oxidoreductase [Steroidobacteraceae bacterium]|nr:SDR family NAD(P)-dependent oxidoreductase [Steroidobacteraceae bacterium]